MISKTQAIVLSSIKYGDNDKIVKLYTREFGIQSFIAKGIYTKKNKINSTLQALNRVEVVFDEKYRGHLAYFKEVKPIEIYRNISNSPQKIAILFFLSDVLNSVLQEEQANEELFQFISDSILAFDLNQLAFADFHLWFLYQLSQYLGFFPNFTTNSLYFDLKEGVSTNTQPTEYALSGEVLKLFEKLHTLDFLNDNSHQFNRNQRKTLLEVIIQYYELHSANFRRPKSFEVLSVIFE